MEDLQVVFPGNYIGGDFHFCNSGADGEIVYYNPSNITKEVIRFNYKYELVDKVVTRASEAFISWSKVDHHSRCTYLGRIKELVVKNKDRIIDILGLENGRPNWDAENEYRDALTIFDRLNDFMEQQGDAFFYNSNSKTSEGYFRKPIGVVSVLSSFAMPFYDSMANITTALIAGNTVIYKPSIYASAVGTVITDILHRAELPIGVFNTIYGDKKTGSRLVSHAGVQGVFYSGFWDEAAQIKKDVLGFKNKATFFQTFGKNSCIIMNDSDIELAAKACIHGAFLSSGQRFQNTRRIIVQEDIVENFIESFLEIAKNINIGGAFEENVFMGPLHSDQAVKQFQRFQGIAARECDQVLRWGKEIANKEGLLVSPGVHFIKEKKAQSSAYEDTVFTGPDVVIYQAQTLEQACNIANDTVFCSISSIYTHEPQNFHKFVEYSKANSLLWNAPTTEFSFHLPSSSISRSPVGAATGLSTIYNCTLPVSFYKYPEQEEHSAISTLLRA